MSHPVTTRSGIYRGIVHHVRDLPEQHQFHYEIPYFLFNLDELPSLDRLSRVFAVNRKAWFSWYDSDHGDGTNRPYRAYLDELLLDHGISSPAKTYLVMTLPRTLGYAFNPLTVVHCLDHQGQTLATVYEVNNTAGERVNYVITTENQTAQKAMPVSPFFESSGTYRFEAPVPAERLSLRIVYRDVSGGILNTSFNGHREPFTARALRRTMMAYPLVALKVIAAIHFEALKLWFKGVPFIGLSSKPQQPLDTRGIKET
jgi:uncharacterized protein